MTASTFNPVAIPGWYRTERETEKTIEKLKSVKELDYYLRNPDEYIRRLAILRLHKITDKESLNILKETLDNPVESEENKYLASWVLKSLSNKWATDIFITNKYLGKFNGYEGFDELFIIKLEQSSHSVDFDFTSSLSYSALMLDSDEIALERDIFFETDFDFKQWFASFGNRLLKAAVITLCAIPKLIIKLPIVIGKAVYYFIKKLSEAYALNREIKSNRIKAVKSVKAVKEKKEKLTLPSVKRLENATKIKQSTISNEYYSLRKELYKKSGVFDFIKKGVFQLLYFMFFPVRLVLRHKLAVLCVLLLVYILLYSTNYGRAFTNKYMAIDLREMQKNTVQKVKDYSAYAFSEFNKLTGMDDWIEKEKIRQSNSPNALIASDVKSPVSDHSKYYVVTAKKGLNIRKSPDSASERVGDNSLTFGSLVIYLSKTESDTSGAKWFFVEAKDGRIGWVSAAYLQEKKEG